LLKTSWTILSEITKHELKYFSVYVDNPALFTVNVDNPALFTVYVDNPALFRVYVDNPALFTLPCQQHQYRQP